MSQKDPPRLFDPASGAPEAVRAVLRAGRRELPGDADLARLAARLPLGPPPAGGGGGPPAAGPLGPSGAAGGTAVAASSTLSGAVVGALLALGVVGGVWLRQETAAPTAPPGVALQANSADPSAAPRSQPVPSAKTEPPSAASAAPSPSQSAARAPTARTDPEPPTPDAVPGPTPATGEGDSEIQLLQRAERALGANPAGALAVAEDHARRFPGGALAQERELIAVAALVALGRAPEARARAERFVAAHPGSAHRRRIEAIVNEGLLTPRVSEGADPPPRR